MCLHAYSSACVYVGMITYLCVYVFVCLRHLTWLSLSPSMFVCRTLSELALCPSVCLTAVNVYFTAAMSIEADETKTLILNRRYINIGKMISCVQIGFLPESSIHAR